MFSFGDLDEMVKMLKGQKEQGCHKGKDEAAPEDGNGFGPVKLTPGQLLVIAGFIGNVLEVNSVLVNKSQAIEIVLTGSLKRPTQLDNIMAQVVQMPFETVLKSILSNMED